MNTYKVTLEVSDTHSQFTPSQLEAALRDLLNTAVLPAIGLELNSSTVTKKRG